MWRIASATGTEVWCTIGLRIPTSDRRQTMDHRAKKRTREVDANVVSVNGEAASEIEHIKRVKLEDSAHLDLTVSRCVKKKRRKKRRKKRGCCGADLKVSACAAVNDPSSLDILPEQVEGQAGSETDSVQKLVPDAGEGCAKIGLAPDVAWMEERVLQYVQRMSVLVTRPPLQEVDEEEMISYGAPNPALFRHAIDWRPVPATVRTKVAVCNVRKNVAVTLTREAVVVDSWVERQKGTLFGMDAEWRPRFKKSGPDSKVAVLQIAAETECLIVQMLFLDRMPASLVKFLENPEMKLAGVGIQGDSRRLNRDYGLTCKGEVELTNLAAAAFKNDELLSMGLKKLAKKVINVEMEKPKHVTMSNWAKQVLDPTQVQYACTDAWISFAIFHTLVQRRARINNIQLAVPPNHPILANFNFLDL